MGLFNIFKKGQKASGNIDNLKGNKPKTKDDLSSKSQKVDEQSFKRAIEYVAAGIIHKNDKSEVLENLIETGFSKELANNFYIDSMASIKKRGFSITGNILMDTLSCVQILFDEIDQKKYTT